MLSLPRGRAEVQPVRDKVGEAVDRHGVRVLPRFSGRGRSEPDGVVSGLLGIVAPATPSPALARACGDPFEGCLVPGRGAGLREPR